MSRAAVVGVLLLSAGCAGGGFIGDPTPPERPPDEPFGGLLRLTEVVAANQDGLRDADGDSPDWLELHNASPEALDLAAYTIADTVEDDGFPLSGILEAGARTVVFASGKDRRSGELHTDFRLDAAGELLVLRREGSEISRSTSPALEPDVAYGAVGMSLIDRATPYRWSESPGDGWADVDHADDDWSAGSGSLGTGSTGGDVLDGRVAALESWWTFDEEDGLVTDLGGDHDGTLEAGAARTEDGRVGRGLSGAVGGWMAAGDPTTYDFAEDFTWSLWMRGTDASGALISRNPAGTGWNQGSKALFVRSGTVQFDAGWVGNPRTGADVTDGRWHHVAVTYERASDAMRIYVDGTARYDDAFDNDAFPETIEHNGGRANTGLFVGQANSSGGLGDLGKYDGTLDEVAIWSEALDAAEIARLAAGASPGSGGAQTPAPEGAERLVARWVVPLEDPASIVSLELDLTVEGSATVLWNGTEVAVSGDGPVPLSLGALRTENVLAVEVVDQGDGMLLAVALGAETATVARLEAPSPGAINARAASGIVTLSPSGGVFASSVSVTASAAPGAVVRYTTDGSAPGPNSNVWSGALEFDATTSVRARAFEPERGAGPIVTGTYVLLDAEWTDRTWDLPVIALAMASPPGDSYGDAALLAWDTTRGPVDLDDPPDTIATAAVRRRGASSRSQPKAPYRVEVRDALGEDLDVPLLGLPAEADWVLHAPYIDKSLMRNALAFELGRELGLQAPRTAYAHLLLLAGDATPEAVYRGIYVLIETVKASPVRLDLDILDPESPAADGGWMLKFEGTVARPPLVPGWGELEFNEPDPPTEAQNAAVEDWLLGFEDFLFGPDFDDPTVAAAWIDEASWIDLWVINELFRDQDAYRRSHFIHKPAGAGLAMGPLWDFNLVAGTGGYFENTSTAGWQWEQQYNQAEHGWYVRRMEDPAFVSAAAARWRELRQGVLSDDAVAARIESHAQRLEESAAENFARWDNLDQDPVHGFVSPATQTWRQQVEQLRGWLAERSAWMDGETR